MRAKKNGLAGVLERHDAVKRLASKRAVANRQRFIDHQNIGLHAGGYGKSQAHEHAAGIRLHRLADKVADVGKSQNAVQPLIDLGPAQPQNGGIHVNVFQPGEVGVEAGSQFQQRCHPAFDLQLAAASLQRAADHLQQG